MSWNPKYIFLLIVVTAVSYFAALLLEKQNSTVFIRKSIVAVTVVICLGILFVFKYFSFFINVITDVFGLMVSDKYLGG